MPQLKNMVIFDANMILRYFLQDNEIMANRAKQYLLAGNVAVTIEVIAEAVYVLHGLYKMKRPGKPRTSPAAPLPGLFPSCCVKVRST